MEGDSEPELPEDALKEQKREKIFSAKTALAAMFT